MVHIMICGPEKNHEMQKEKKDSLNFSQKVLRERLVTVPCEMVYQSGGCENFGLKVVIFTPFSYEIYTCESFKHANKHDHA